jgi:eukaryotic-like serine/threonine-protein kinase
MPDALEADFPGTHRFAVRRRLGAGAYGVVYEAFDRERGGVVALKTLRSGNVEALYRLKREFRALADITHPNLVTLYELLTDGEQWFFTLELVEGCNFLQYVRAQPEAAAPLGAAGGPGSTVSEPTLDSITGAGGGSLAERSTSFDSDRLRDALRQAVSGLAALHDAGKLHRDIKPSNVLVTREGRVVLLDFGLVTELDPFGDDRSLSLVGTPAYMSPEQGSRIPVSEKSDWYSLGIVLYEALADRQPFGGSFMEMMWEKGHSEPTPPQTLLPGVPDDLNALCVALLRRDPNARPAAGEILRRLGGTPTATPPAAEASPLSLRPGPFVGRQAHLSALREAFEASRSGQAVSVYIHGTSGIGKSALVRRFLEELRKDDVVILTGRCYERESLPFKALDSLVDSLSQYLKRLPVEQAEALLPTDVLALARVFPVLRRLEAVASTRRRTAEIADSFELRRRAFAALRELLTRLASKRDVVLFIDDLQWGDVDSAALLDELTRPPDAPALLLIVCYRGEEAATSPLLQKLLTRPEAADARRLAVEELPPSEARELALALLGTNPSVLLSQADVIVRESAGNPFFIDGLARFGGLGETTTIDDMVRARVLQLPEPARHLLEFVVVAGQPLDAEVAEYAADAGETNALTVLRAGHLVRLRVRAERREIETYHDRIREAVVAQLSPDTLRRNHLRLAMSLEASGRADPEALALHFREAGDAERAAEFAAVAAERAVQALAFDRAAGLYRAALELGPPDDTPARRDLNRKLGDALANASRGKEAARAYLAAAEGASRAEMLELERRAADQLLRSGHIDEALPILERITGRVGLTLVQPSWRTLLLLLAERALIRLRGVHFRERDPSQIPPEDLIRLDTYWDLQSGVSLINAARAREFQNRFYLLALKAGDPYRASLALATEAVYHSAFGGYKKRRRAHLALGESRSLAERIKHPYTMATVPRIASSIALWEGRWKDCWHQGQVAEAILRERCTGVAWDLDWIHIFCCASLRWMGELRELSLRLPLLIREAMDRDDMLVVASLRLRNSYMTSLASDEPEMARDTLRQVIEKWSGKGFQQQHYFALVSAVEIALFESNAKGAWQLLSSDWPRFERSRLIRIQLFRLEASFLRARCALACAAQIDLSTRARETFLRSAARDARRIEREAAPWAMPLATLTRSGIAVAHRDLRLARRLLGAAEEALANVDMGLYAAAARRRRGELFGGNEGRALMGDADAWMAGQDIRNPGRMADMLAPGRWS